MGQGDGMEIVCIGAGNLATRLCVALQQCGHRVVQVFSRTEECAAALAAQLGCEPVCRLEDVTPEAPLYILSVRDQVLEEVAHGLYASLLRRVAPGGSNVGAGALFVHTAGSMPLDVLPMLRRGVFYPMQTFSKQREVPFAGLPVFIESPTDAAVLRTLAESMGCGVYEMDSASRRYLHLAAVFACNFSNHMYDVCARVLARKGIPFEVMLPLIDETARKVHALTPREAQTGPAVRYDQTVMQRHLDLLEDEDLKQIYNLLSQHIHQYTL